MKFFFIRHGQTDWNIQGKIQGSYDSELNETGMVQAKELGDEIAQKNYRFSKIYTSPQKRALKTAEILSTAVNIDYHVIDGFKEIDMGLWEGLSWDQVKENYSKEYNEWSANRRYTKTPQGESYQDMLERVLKSLHQIAGEITEDAAIITHSAVIMGLQCYITGTPFHQMLKFKLGNTAIVEIDSQSLPSI